MLLICGLLSFFAILKAFCYQPLCSDSNIHCVGTGYHSEIQDAIDEVTLPGQKVYIQGGTYITYFSINSAHGTFSNPIEILPYPQENVHIIMKNSTLRPPEGTLFAMDIRRNFWKIHSGEGYLRFSGGNTGRDVDLIRILTSATTLYDFTMGGFLNGRYRSLINIEDNNNVDGIVIEKIRFDETINKASQVRFYIDVQSSQFTYEGSKIYSADRRIFIKDCVFENSGALQGINMERSSFIKITGNYFWKNDNTMTTNSFIGVDDSFNVKIENNIFHYNFATAENPPDRAFIGVWHSQYLNTTANVLVQNNLFHGVSYKRNVFYISFNDLGQPAYTRNMVVQNNYFKGDLSPSSLEIIYDKTQCQNCYFRNNLLEYANELFNSGSLWSSSGNTFGTLDLHEYGNKPIPFFRPLEAQFGVNQSPSPMCDFENKKRSNPLTIGPFEYIPFLSPTNCLGNYDPLTNCTTCLNHWENNCDLCGTCPDLWDPDKECNNCVGNWNASTNCTTCVGNWDVSLNCSVCN